MKRASVALALALGLAGASACSKVTYRSPGTAPSGQVAETTGWFFIFGLVGQETIPVYQMCPGGVHMIQSRYSFLDVVIHVITFNLVAPRSYVVQCGGGS